MFFSRVSGGISWRQEMDSSRVSKTFENDSPLLYKAYSTSFQYHPAIRKWKEFAVCKFKETSFPADPFHVALYLQHLIEESQSPSVIDSVFYGIKWSHDGWGSLSNSDNSVVEAFTVGIQENSWHCCCQP